MRVTRCKVETRKGRRPADVHVRSNLRRTPSKSSSVPKKVPASPKQPRADKESAITQEMDDSDSDPEISFNIKNPAKSSPDNDKTERRSSTRTPEPQNQRKPTKKVTTSSQKNCKSPAASKSSPEPTRKKPTRKTFVPSKKTLSTPNRQNKAKFQAGKTKHKAAQSQQIKRLTKRVSVGNETSRGDTGHPKTAGRSLSPVVLISSPVVSLRRSSRDLQTPEKKPARKTTSPSISLTDVAKVKVYRVKSHENMKPGEVKRSGRQSSAGLRSLEVSLTRTDGLPQRKSLGSRDSMREKSPRSMSISNKSNDSSSIRSLRNREPQVKVVLDKIDRARRSGDPVIESAKKVASKIVSKRCRSSFGQSVKVVLKDVKKAAAKPAPRNKKPTTPRSQGRVKKQVSYTEPDSDFESDSFSDDSSSDSDTSVVIVSRQKTTGSKGQGQKLKEKSEKEKQAEDLERLKNQAVWKFDQLVDLQNVKAKNNVLRSKIQSLLESKSGDSKSDPPPTTTDKRLDDHHKKMKAELLKADKITLQKELQKMEKDIDKLDDVMNTNMELESRVQELLYPGANLTNKELDEKRKEDHKLRQKQAMENMLRMQQKEAERLQKMKLLKEKECRVVDKANKMVDTVINNLMLGFQSGAEWPADMAAALLPVKPPASTSSPLPSTSVQGGYQTPVKEGNAEKGVAPDSHDTKEEEPVVLSDSDSSLDDVSASSSSSSEEEKGRKSLRGKKGKATKGRRSKKEKNTDSDLSDVECLDNSDDENDTSRVSRRKRKTPASKKRQSSRRQGRQSSDSDIEIISEKGKSKVSRRGKGKATDTSNESPGGSDSEIEIVSRSTRRSSTRNTDSSSKKMTNAKNKRKKTDSSENEAQDDHKKIKRSRTGKKSANTKKTDSGSGSSSDEDGKSANNRKKIRKLIKARKLDDATKEAARAERERLKRVEMIKSQHKIVQVEDPTSPGRCPLTTQLVLEFDSKKRPLVEVNRNLVKKLKPHQVEAVQFLWDSCIETVDSAKKQKGSGCILAHCMGLGKTLSVIALVHTLLTHKCTGIKTCLVVCPLNTVLNWETEWGKWLAKKDLLTVYQLASVRDNKGRSKLLTKWQATGGVMIIGYQMFRILNTLKSRSSKLKDVFMKTLTNPGPDIVVCDEGHMLKNDASGISKCMNEMKTARRIVLTGTPLQNNLTEYHCMVQFVKPRLLGTRKEFFNRFVNPITNGQCSDSTPSDVRLMKRRSHVLHDLLAGCVQRRDYSVITRYLPEKCEYVLSVRLSPVQCQLYANYLKQVGRDVDNFQKGALAGVRLFTDYHNLLHIWTHPWVLKMDEVRQEEKAIRNMDSDESDLDLIESSTDDLDSEDEDDEEGYDSEASDKPKKRKRGNDSDLEGRGAGNKGAVSNPKKMKTSVKDISDIANDIIKKQTTSRRLSAQAAMEKIELTASKAPVFVRQELWWHQFVKEEDEYKMALGGKIVLLFDILKLAAENHEKILVFSHSLLSLNLIESFLEYSAEEASKKTKNKAKKKNSLPTTWTRDLDYYRMDGSTLAHTRKKCVAAFQDPNNKRARLFLISTKAGGLGINLEAANRVIIFDASWNPSHDIQSIFRVYRFGQMKPCFVYRFLAQGTMEEKIYERQVIKQTLSKRVVDEQQIQRHFTSDDLQALYQFKPSVWDENEARPVPMLPKDVVLAELLKTRPEWIVSYHEHDSLLENQEQETLNEDERKAAWAEYEKEKHDDKHSEGVARQTIVSRFHRQLKAQIPNVAQVVLKQFPGISDEDVMKRLQAFVEMQLKSTSRNVVYQQDNIKKQLAIQNQNELALQLRMAQQKQRIGLVQPQGVPASGFLSQGLPASGLLYGAKQVQNTATGTTSTTHPNVITPRYFTHSAPGPRVIMATQSGLPVNSQMLQNLKFKLPEGLANGNYRIIQAPNTGVTTSSVQPKFVLATTTAAGSGLVLNPSHVNKVPIARVLPSITQNPANIRIVQVNPAGGAAQQ